MLKCPRNLLAGLTQHLRASGGQELCGIRGARYRRRVMAAGDDKVNVALDAEIIERTRSALGADSESDAVVVERALNAYLLGRILDLTQTASGLSAEEAERLAYDEVRAARRERGAA